MRADSLRMEEGQQAYRIAWLAMILGLAAAGAVLYASRMTVDFRVLLSYDGILVLLFTLHVIYSKYRPIPAVARATGSLGLMIACALLAGIIANAGMRLRYPLVDAQLAAADRALGIDTGALVLAVAERPALAEFLGVTYTSIFPLAFATALLLAVRGKARRLWELTAGFGGGIVIAAITSVFLPALGNFSHAGLEHLSGKGLPAGSGIYHLHAVTRYRDGLDPLLDVSKLEGVVTFPSFHMVMAIAVAYVFRATGVFGWLVYGWCALVAVSTIPIGGHYVVDLVAGAMMWALLRQAFNASRIDLPRFPRSIRYRESRPVE